MILMDLPYILANPKKYRCGKNFRATNKVFPIKANDQRFIYKEYTFLSSVANLFYNFEDIFFFGNRKPSSKKSRL